MSRFLLSACLAGYKPFQTFSGDGLLKLEEIEPETTGCSK